MHLLEINLVSVNCEPCPSNCIGCYSPQINNIKRKNAVESSVNATNHDLKILTSTTAKTTTGIP